MRDYIILSYLFNFVFILTQPSISKAPLIEMSGKKLDTYCSIILVLIMVHVNKICNRVGETSP